MPGSFSGSRLEGDPILLLLGSRFESELELFFEGRFFSFRLQPLLQEQLQVLQPWGLLVRERQGQELA